jgi:hypothetical protein
MKFARFTSFIVASLLSCGTAMAQTTPPTAVTTPIMSAQTSATTMSEGGALSMDSHAVYNTDSRFAVATAVGPALTSSNDTCMGSTSAGVQGMSVGVSIGTTWEDHNCKMLKNSREMWNMGMRGAAIKLLCSDPDNRFALESTGVDCGETKTAWEQNGSKVAVAPVPVPQVAALPAPVVVLTNPQAKAVEQHAAEIIQQDQDRKQVGSQVASK